MTEQNEQHKTASPAPEARLSGREIREAWSGEPAPVSPASIREEGGKFHIYTPFGNYHCTCVNRDDAERVMSERFPAPEARPTLPGRVIGKRHTPNQNDAPEYYSETASPAPEARQAAIDRYIARLLQATINRVEANIARNVARKAVQ